MKLKAVLCLLIITGFCSLASGQDDKKTVKDLETVEQNSHDATKSNTGDGARSNAKDGVDSKGTYKEPVRLGDGTKTADQLSTEGNAKIKSDQLTISEDYNRKNKAGAPPPLTGNKPTTTTTSNPAPATKDEKPILSTTALAQSGETDLPLRLRPVPPYLTMVNNWLQAELANAREAQAANQNTLNACRALLEKALNAHNATAVAAAQRAVNTAEEGLRKNRLREQRALKAISWVERLRQERNSSAKVAGFMPRIEGTVEIQSAGGGAARPVTSDTPPVLGPGDTLRTGKDGHADVLLNEGGIFSLDAGSALMLAEKGADALLYGEIRYRLQRKYEVRTPAAVCAVRGTQFVLREIPGKPASVVVIDGTVAFSDIKGTKTVLVGAGQQSYLLPDGTPSEPAKANLQEMKKWWEE